ncbi:restriction endonuclease subunit S [Bacillus mycoides]|uniref:restriction endonuclease subunit S n=1 Tax=Bacillus mycoides TaxID=1405 RepID=UPI00065BC351|nr:restriction endonuclease subunit S [Bacillus mycoides]KMQ14012.1 hypothetical protein TU70_25760 [Bacillus mycoides]
MSKKQKNVDELLEEAVVPEEEQPYEVPENWRWVKLGSVISLISGRDVSAKLCNSEGKGTPYIMGASNISDNKLNIERWIETPTVIGVQGDILISVKGTIGKIIIQELEEAHLSRQIMALRCKDKVLNKYLYFYISIYIEKLKEAARGVIPGISRDDILNVPFLLPPLNEQKRIAKKVERLLIKIDEAKQLIEEAKETFELRRAAILDKAFCGELTAKWREKNEVKNQNWKIIDLEEVAFAIDPQPSHRTPAISSDGIPYIGVKECNYETGEIDFSNARPVSNTVLSEHINRYSINDGDFIIGKIGTVGKPFNIPTERKYVLSANVILIQPKKEMVIPKYLFYLFQSSIIENQLNAGVNATTQAAFGIKKVRKLQVNLCSINEQQRIVELLDNIFENETKAKELSETSHQINIIKNSILSKAFRGELGTNDPSEENAIELLKEVLQEQVK